MSTSMWTVRGTMRRSSRCSRPSRGIRNTRHKSRYGRTRKPSVHPVCPPPPAPSQVRWKSPGGGAHIHLARPRCKCGTRRPARKAWSAALLAPLACSQSRHARMPGTADPQIHSTSAMKLPMTSTWRFGGSSNPPFWFPGTQRWILPGSLLPVRLKNSTRAEAI